MPNAALTREQLDKLSCSTPGCSHEGHPLILHGRCHPKAPQRVRFSVDDKALEVHCATCNLFISLIAVHPEEAALLIEKLGGDEIESARAQGLSPGMRLRSMCHRSAGLYAVYSNGHLTVACAHCQTPAQTFHVLERHLASA